MLQLGSLFSTSGGEGHPSLAVRIWVNGKREDTGGPGRRWEDRQLIITAARHRLRAREAANPCFEQPEETGRKRHLAKVSLQCSRMGSEGASLVQTEENGAQGAESKNRKLEEFSKEWSGAGKGGHSVVQDGSRGQSDRAAMPSTVTGDGVMVKVSHADSVVTVELGPSMLGMG